MVIIQMKYPYLHNTPLDVSDPFLVPRMKTMLPLNILCSTLAVFSKSASSKQAPSVVSHHYRS